MSTGRPGGDPRRSTAWWIILLLSVLITVGTAASWIVAWVRSSAPEPPQVIPAAFRTDSPLRPVFITEPINEDLLDPVAGVLADLSAYWAGPGGAAVGSPGPYLTGPVLAVDTGVAEFTGDSPACAGQPSRIAGNIYFCPQDDGLLLDFTALVPVLADHYGQAGLTGSLAHEYGHAVQAVIGPTLNDRITDPERYPPLLIELQADCYAGAFLATTDLPPDQAFAPLVEFADPPGIDPADPAAHGTATDRLRAATLGLTDGPTACRDLDLATFD